MTEIETLIQRGFDAWSSGDLDTLELILDPNVTLRAIESGPWDNTYIAASDDSPELDDPDGISVATRITVTNGKVTIRRALPDACESLRMKPQ